MREYIPLDTTSCLPPTNDRIAVIIIGPHASSPTAEAVTQMLQQCEEETGKKFDRVIVERQEDYEKIIFERSLAPTLALAISVESEHYQQTGRVGKGERKRNKANRWR